MQEVLSTSCFLTNKLTQKWIETVVDRNSYIMFPTFEIVVIMPYSKRVGFALIPDFLKAFCFLGEALCVTYSVVVTLCITSSVVVTLCIASSVVVTLCITSVVVTLCITSSVVVTLCITSSVVVTLCITSSVVVTLCITSSVVVTLWARIFEKAFRARSRALAFTIGDRMSSTLKGLGFSNW